MMWGDECRVSRDMRWGDYRCEDCGRLRVLYPVHGRWLCQACMNWHVREEHQGG